MLHRPRPAVRRAILAVPFLAAILLAMRLDGGPGRAAADAAHPGFVLRDETAAAGIHFVHNRPTFDPQIASIEPHVAALGASVSVADFDGDGRPDLYFTNSRFGEPNALYRNKGDGTFEDVAATVGLADLNRPGDGVSMGAVWGDFDNDGREDVLVYRYGYLALFRNVDGNNFEEVTSKAGLRRWVNSNGAIWLDYDRDGLLDLYVTVYFRDVDLWHLATTKIMHNSFEFATNGGKNLLFHNLGGGKFEDVTDKTGVVDLAGKFPTKDHHVRIRTNMQIYWDQAFLSGDAAGSPVKVTTLAPVAADLHFRGFSRMYRKGGRYGPYWFAYDAVSKESPWRPIEGAFTRFGDVLPLLGNPDDMYLIMGPGDETTVQFDATSASTLPAGWKRDFLLYTDGWIKDSDLNTAFGNTVGPLPFHRMKEYPYAPGESYPTDAEHQRYLRAYNTRILQRR